MEKEPKIGQSLEGDIAIPEFDREDSEVKPRPESYEETVDLKSGSEEPVFVDASKISNKQLFWVMFWHSDKLPDDIRAILDKKLRKEGITSEEQSRLDVAKEKWFLERFGVTFGHRRSLPEKSFKIEMGVRQNEKNIASNKKEKLQGQSSSESTDLEINKRSWLQIVLDARKEFPTNIQVLIEKRIENNKLSDEDAKVFTPVINDWWKERFGSNLWPSSVDMLDKKAMEVKIRMNRLHQALVSLDEGEPVDEFRDETRRIIYYDEETDKYFLNEGGNEKYLGLGDVMSDYAWGIKYVPDGEMSNPAYRMVAKRILINETRRDMEPVNSQTRPENLEKNAKNRITDGFVAEVEARELLSRIASDSRINLNVMRASYMEDSEYKYDFKVRSYVKNRGVDIESGSDTIRGSFKRIGIQFTIGKKGGKKISNIQEGLRKARKDTQENKLKKIPVDDIILIRVPTDEFGKTFRKWLEAGKPSGGPEQFLSGDLKVKLLKEVTKGLVEISDEDIERIFPLSN